MPLHSRYGCCNSIRFGIDPGRVIMLTCDPEHIANRQRLFRMVSGPLNDCNDFVCGRVNTGRSKAVMIRNPHRIKSDENTTRIIDFPFRNNLGGGDGGWDYNVRDGSWDWQCYSWYTSREQYTYEH